MQHLPHDVLTGPDRPVVSFPSYHASLHGASARIGLVIVGTAPIGQDATKGNDRFSSGQGDTDSLVGAMYIFPPIANGDRRSNVCSAQPLHRGWERVKGSLPPLVSTRPSWMETAQSSHWPQINLHRTILQSSHSEVLDPRT